MGLGVHEDLAEVQEDLAEDPEVDAALEVGVVAIMGVAIIGVVATMVVADVGVMAVVMEPTMVVTTAAVGPIPTMTMGGWQGGQRLTLTA